MFKNKVNLTVNQKSSLLAYIKIFTRKNSTCSEEEIFVRFIEEQNYFFEINQPKFEWIYDYYDDRFFVDGVKAAIKENLKKIRYKERNKEYIEKQKKFIKEARLHARTWRQSKEKPSKKQILYYKALCDKYKLQEEDINNKSKADLKNMIAKALEKGVKNEL